jgi:hypothetical protein
MPYIRNETVQQLENNFGAPAYKPDCPGELNYKITELITNYLPENPRYADYNEVIGVLECAKLELYRRLISPYEETKISDPDNIDPYDELEEQIFDPPPPLNISFTGS